MEEMMQWVRYSKSIGWNLNGRARRSEYWWNSLYYWLISFSVGILSGMIGLGFVMFGAMFSDTSETMAIAITSMGSLLQMGIGLILNIWVLYRTIPIMVRRLHDRGMSGWIYWLFLLFSCLCGIGAFIMLVILCLDSQPGNNQYGPNPKEQIPNMGTTYYG